MLIYAVMVLLFLTRGALSPVKYTAPFNKKNSHVVCLQLEGIGQTHAFDYTSSLSCGFEDAKTSRTHCMSDLKKKTVTATDRLTLRNLRELLISMISNRYVSEVCHRK